jgi:RNA pseudouridylate synthase/S4 domain
VRLDSFLAQRGAAPSRAAAQRLIEAGAVTVGGRSRPKNHRLAPGDEVGVARAEEEPAATGEVRFEVVFEDEYLLVVDKPAGVVIHSAPGHRGPTLAQALAGSAAGGADPERAGIVHRLDRDTSGLLVVARSEEAHAALRRLMRARQIVREYLALVGGRPAAESGTAATGPGAPSCPLAPTAPAPPSRTFACWSGWLEPRCCACGSRRAGRTRSAPTWRRLDIRSAETETMEAQIAGKKSAWSDNFSMRPD